MCKSASGTMKKPVWGGCAGVSQTAEQAREDPANGPRCSVGDSDAGRHARESMNGVERSCRRVECEHERVAHWRAQRGLCSFCEGKREEETRPCRRKTYTTGGFCRKPERTLKRRAAVCETRSGSASCTATMVLTALTCACHTRTSIFARVGQNNSEAGVSPAGVRWDH